MSRVGETFILLSFRLADGFLLKYRGGMLFASRLAAAHAIAILAAVVCVAPCARADDSIVKQVLALVMFERASIVIEMAAPVAEVSDASGADPSTIVLEAGPLDTTPRAQDLTAERTLPWIADVSLRAFTRTGRSYLRVRVRLRAAGHHSVRVVGHRLYIDVTPPPHADALANNLEPPPTAVSREDPLTAYRSLESDIEKRSLALAARADVKALEALLAEIDRRDRALGRQQPETVERSRSTVAQRLVEARALRLKLDGAAFRESLHREQSQ